MIRYSKNRAVAYESAHVEKMIKNLRSNVERNHERAVTVSLDEVVDFLHSDSLRRVVELRLQGMADRDIASRAGVTPDGVQRG